MKKILKYTHPSANNYSITEVYGLEDLQQELDLEMIKVLFSPVNFEWSDLENKKKVNKVEEKQE